MTDTPDCFGEYDKSEYQCREDCEWSDQCEILTIKEEA